MAEKTHSDVKNRQCNIIGSLYGFIVAFIQNTLSSIEHGIFSLVYSFVRERKIPPATNPLLKESAVSLAQKIRTKNITAVEVVGVFINRIKEVNPIVNALVDERFEDAIKEAKKVDEFIRSDSMSAEEIKIQKPLLGVPFTAKEEIAAKGLSWTLGLISRKGRKATEDAKVLQGLKNSGAILIGLTNIPEFCCWVETRNLIFGQTSNPYNTNRSAGGSSGGEACLVSCCGSPIGLGSDSGGSIRIPAFCCGVYGHKLSGGLINTKGISCRDGTESEPHLLTSGTITKYAVDLKPSSTAIIAPEKLPLLQLDLKVDIKKLKFYYLLDPKMKHITRVDKQIRDGLKKLVTVIADTNEGGIPPQEANIPGLENVTDLFAYWAAIEDVDFPRLLTDGKGSVNLWAELPKKIFGLSNYTLPSLLMVADLKFNSPPPESWAVKATEKLKEEFMKYLDDGGVLLLPGGLTPAPYHYQPFIGLYDYIYYGLCNVLQLPATVVPIGITNNGLPIGIQVIAAQNQDRLCFAVAEYIESVIGGWVPPFSN
ncbi:hypothetical protein V9T40_002547 [Parthenolecanium corni]|uniref:Amidase domain-containing protein n=1 Tax=Parthenolecanium corni TaxID=536013 RepID=A0AAN9TIM1_9HEMI